MDAQNQTNKRLAELEFLAGSLESDDLFVETYQEMLEEVRADGDPNRRRNQLLAIQKTLFKQFLFLQYEWLKEKGLVPKHEQGKSSHVS